MKHGDLVAVGGPERITEEQPDHSAHLSMQPLVDVDQIVGFGVSVTPVLTVLILYVHLIPPDELLDAGGMI